MLDVAAQLSGRQLLVMGGTGFLGKVWVSMLLARFPDVAHLHMVVRERRGPDGALRQSSEERFWGEIVPSPVFDPIREQHGDGFEAFIRQKITPIPGDVTRPFAGVPDEVRDRLRGKLHALVNASGVVDFNPPLDHALEVNAFGMQNLVALVRDLTPEGAPALSTLHTSTCYVAGDRTGQVDEVNPLDHPFPRCGELERSHWDPAREISECVDLIDNVRHRSADAFRQSAFLDEACRNLTDKSEPTRGTALADELARVKRKYEENQLTEGGTERAKYWGWHNTYTYTKSIGEQILLTSDVPCCIVRPAVIESALVFPSRGWNEGINTSAPLIYMCLQGPVWYPSREDTVLDVIAVDHVAIGMLLALAELLEGAPQVIYQMGTSDTAPLGIMRLIELTGLYKRRSLRRNPRGNPLVSWVQARAEPVPLSTEDYYARGPRHKAAQTRKLSGLLGRFKKGPLAPFAAPLQKGIDSVTKGLEVHAYISDQFVPFMATHNYRFSCAHTRAAFGRLSDAEKELLPWAPEEMDWFDYLMEIHYPGIERNVTPLIEAKMKRDSKPLRRYDHLIDLLDEAADRHDLAPALQLMEEDGLSRVSYRDLRGRAIAVATRLHSVGLKKGDRVLLAGNNHPDWSIAYFGILRAGCVAVPMDAGIEPPKAAGIAAASGASLAILDQTARDHLGTAVTMPIADLHEVSAMGAVGIRPEPSTAPDDLASVLFTSGTTGDPKGVMLTHGNFTALLSSLGKLFPLEESDRLLSVLPLHHAFEFTCGLLLPLSMGARILYPGEITGERLAEGLQKGRITCMVGVPALWQLLERRIRSQVDQRGRIFSTGFDGALEANRKIGRVTGLDLGRLMFGSIHSRFGGNIRMLISGGAALPKDTQKLFSGLGLHLSEGYGLTEAAPVLTVAMPGPGSSAGHVGKPIPGVKIRIRAPDEAGIGEVEASGDNVMAGYFGNREATASVLSEDGWLRTGDLGRLDHKGRLVLVGRAKEVVVTSAGENIYLDDTESSLGRIANVKEYALVGLADPRGGERLGLLAVLDDEDDRPTDERHRAARASIDAAVSRLSAVQRPAVIHLVDADLPRTRTRKVQRKAVAETLERITRAAPRRRGGGVDANVAHAIAAVAGISADDLHPGAQLRAEHGFDSLMFVELAAALADAGGARPDAEALERCETVAAVVALVGAPTPVVTEARERGPGPVDIPQFLADPMKQAMGVVQDTFNGPLLGTRVLGRANIPQNRNVIVVSNHTSHLDMGLIKHALGEYGQRIVALAAKDYFFEGNRWKVAYFRYLTNVEPIDRRAGFRTSYNQAREIIESGAIVLLFPEGTRQTSGMLAEFKPMIGKLALETATDILPLHIDGAYASMPKGALLPKKRGITMRIGPPLRHTDMIRHTDGMKASDAARRVAQLTRAAVERLGNGQVLDLQHEAPPKADAPRAMTPSELAERAFKSLSSKYDPARIERPVCWYFSLGKKDGPRWTVSVDKERCLVKPGRPEGAADCVVKTSEDLFTRLVRDRYVPTPAEFMSGAIKTNDLALLIEFSRVFQLSEVEL